MCQIYIGKLNLQKLLCKYHLSKVSVVSLSALLNLYRPSKDIQITEIKRLYIFALWETSHPSSGHLQKW